MDHARETALKLNQDSIAKMGRHAPLYYACQTRKGVDVSGAEKTGKQFTDYEDPRSEECIRQYILAFGRDGID